MNTATGILIVEDEAIIALDLKSILTGIGYNVVGIAASGEEAIEFAKEASPDLILMDIILKGQLDGIEAAAEILDNLGIPVIYMTANADAATIERARKTEPYGYILKPLNTRDIHSNIDSAIYRHRIENKLRESEKRYRELVESVNSIILRFDMSGNINYMNDYGLNFFGYRMDELYGKNILGTLVPASSTTGEDLEKFVTDLLRDPKSYIRNENENIKKNGETVFISWSNRAVIDENGKIKEILCVGNDITDFKHAQYDLEFKAHILDHIRDYILVTNGDGIIEYINEAGANILEYGKDELVGRPIWLLGMEQHGESEQVRVAKQTKDSRSWTGEIINYTKSGKPVLMKCKTWAMTDEKDKVIHLIALSDDAKYL